MCAEEADYKTQELVIYCHTCKSMWQLNPEMIVVALVTDANVWDVYNYIIKQECKECKERCAQNAK